MERPDGRYRGVLLTEAESHAVIEEVNQWCRKTGTNYNKLITAAGVGPSIRSDVVMRGRRLTIMVAQRLRKAIHDNRKGIEVAEHRARLARISTDPMHLPAQQIEARRVNRDPCSLCGARADVGCRHSVVWNVSVTPRW